MATGRMASFPMFADPDGNVIGLFKAFGPTHPPPPQAAGGSTSSFLMPLATTSVRLRAPAPLR